MPIEWNDEARQLHLHNGGISLVLRVLESGHLGQLHLGAPLAPGRDYRHLGRGAFAGFDNRVADPTRFALPTRGSGDFRVPAIAVTHADGSAILHLAYAGHRIFDGKPSIDPLPATYTEDAAEAQILKQMQKLIQLAELADPGTLAMLLKMANEKPEPALQNLGR